MDDRGLKRDASHLDEQFEFARMPDWKDSGKRQKILGSDFVTYEPSSKVEESPTQIDFELKCDHIWLANPNMRFKVSGIFQEKETQNAANWTPVGSDEYKIMSVAPNFLDHLIKRIDIFHGNRMLVFADEGRYISPFLNTYLYYAMSKIQKKKLFIKNADSGLGVPSLSAKWTMADGSQWFDYSQKIFKVRGLDMDFVPIHVPPFWQGTNYNLHGQEQNAIPMPILDKLMVRITFHDKHDHIFCRALTNLKVYRFAFTKFDLVVEQVRAGPTLRSNFLSRKQFLPFRGVTRVVHTETITAALPVYKAKIQNTPFPEGLFIFALPKEVLSGGWTWKGTNDIFSQHNIININLSYGDNPMFPRDLHIGCFDKEVIEYKTFFDYLNAPPFGLEMEKDLVTLANIHGKNTPYPHIFMNLCNYGDKSRIIPYEKDGSIISQPHDLDLIVTFGTGGATTDVVYVVYMYWTDTNIILETSSKSWGNPYIKYTPIV